MPDKTQIEKLLSELEGLNLKDSLKALANKFSGSVAFSSSFSWEDQIILHEIANNHLPVEVFTLDTGRLFPETYSLWGKTIERYKTRVTAYYPEAIDIEKYVSEKGPNAFYESVENRKKCCHIRKVEPLQRALKGKAVWVTGLRAEHSPARHDLKMVEWDDNNHIIKFHPLLHWSTDEVRKFINENNIPYNPLYDRGFVSIGCAPCTRAIKPGEDFRAGRWWWEDNSKKECGLHVTSVNKESVTN